MIDLDFPPGSPTEEPSNMTSRDTGTPSGESESQESLEQQIAQLHCLVQEMKDGFVLAMHELSRIQNGDRVLQETLETHRTESDTKVGQLTEMVQSLQSQLSQAMDEVNKNRQTTSELQNQLQDFRDYQDEIKKKMENLNPVANGAKRTSISSRSDESGFHRDEFEDQKEAVPPMLQPFIDSLPDATTTADPDLSDSDNSVSEAADQMMKLSRKFAEQYHRHRARLTSPSADNALFNRHLNGLGIDNKTHISARKGRASEDNRLAKRHRVAEALLVSERMYVSQLRFIQEGLIQPLVLESFVSLADINVMFPSCIVELYQEHTSLLEALEMRLSDWKWKSIMGDVLARFSGSSGAALFKLYSVYVKSFSDSLSMLAYHIGSSQKFYRFMEKQLAENGQGRIDPVTYLMAPLQRITYYVKSMERLLKYTEESHPDRYHLQTCLKQLNEFVKEMKYLTSNDVPTTSTKEPYRRERRNSKASFSSGSSMETNLRDSGVHSIEEERGVTNNTNPMSVAVDRELWVGRPSAKSKHRPRRKSVVILKENADGMPGNAAGRSYPPQHQSSSRSQYDAQQEIRNSQLVAQYPENSIVPVPGMIGKGNNAVVYASEDPPNSNLIDTTKVKRKSRTSRVSKTRSPSFGVYGEEDTDIERVGYVPSTPANALPRAKQMTNARRYHRNSIDGTAMAFGHHEISDRLAAHLGMVEESNLQKMKYKSSDNMRRGSVTMDNYFPHSMSLTDVKKHRLSKSGDLRDLSMSHPQTTHGGTGGSRLYARRRSIDVGALQARILEERRAEESARVRKKSSPRSPKSKSPTRKEATTSKSIKSTPLCDVLSEEEADIVTDQVFVRTHHIPAEEDEEMREMRHRKTSFKHSFKNIFKRRTPGSRVVELTDGANCPTTSRDNNNYLTVDHGRNDGATYSKSPNPSPRPSERSKSPRPPGPSRSPLIQRAKTPEIETFEDENGEPCSAV